MKEKILYVFIHEITYAFPASGRFNVKAHAYHRLTYSLVQRGIGHRPEYLILESGEAGMKTHWSANIFYVVHTNDNWGKFHLSPLLFDEILNLSKKYLSKKFRKFEDKLIYRLLLILSIFFNPCSIVVTSH